MSEKEAEASERLAALSDRLAHERDDAFPLFTARLAAIEHDLAALADDIRAHTTDLVDDSAVEADVESNDESPDREGR